MKNRLNQFIFIKTNFDEYKEKETERKIEIKKDLLMEIATKADIAEVKGEINALRKELKGDISVLDAKFSGEFKSIRLWMKFLVGIAIIGITFFSPTTLELIKILKSF